LFPALLVAGLATGWYVDPGQHQSLVQYGDGLVRDQVLAHRTPAMMDLLRPIVRLGELQTVFILAVLASLALLLLRRRWQAAVPLAAVVGTDVLVALLKYAIGRPSAVWSKQAGHSFPSGHTAGITALVVSLAVLAWLTRRWWWPAVLAVLVVSAMAVALLVLDAHWLSDVVVGAGLSAAWSWAVATWLPRPAPNGRARHRHECEVGRPLISRHRP
jgi:undecaprenyl-diphosphatase